VILDRFSVAGKVAMVTGAGLGIGRGIAIGLAEAGADVVLAARTVADLDEVAALVRSLGRQALVVPTDVTDAAACERLVALAVEKFGRLDILVNNAGIALSQDFETTTLDDWRRVMAVNLDGVFLGCKHAVRVMKAGGGAIVNLSSVAGLIGDPRLAAYCASKGGVRLLTKSVALHCARRGYGIRCNSVHPSFVETPMLDAMLARARDPAKARAGYAAAAPLGRIAQPNDVAQMILFLASDESAFTTGAEFVVDGGLTAA
jgi:3(or 17)beta-hydroxysteroid dehydrogenase